MIVTITLVVAAICATCAAVRLPAALRGERLPIFWSFVLITVAVALSAQPVYDIVDSMLGKHNFTNLIIRLCLYMVFMLLGGLIAKSFDSMLVQWLIAGRPGLIVIGFAGGVTITSHLLGAFATKDLFDTPAGAIYSLVWQFYLAYVAICLLTVLLPAAFTPNPDRTYRLAAVLYSIGFILVVCYPAVTVTNVLLRGDWTYVMALALLAVLFVAAGSMVGWVARRMRHRKAQSINA